MNATPSRRRFAIEAILFLSYAVFSVTWMAISPLARELMASFEVTRAEFALLNTVETATHTEYEDASGKTLVETWVVNNMGHGTAIEPGFAPAGGCGTASSFILSAGICSTYYAAKFFGLDSALPAIDAGVQPGPDAGHAPGADAGQVAEPDAGGFPGLDASVVAGPDASASACADWFDNNYAQVIAKRAQQCGDYNAHACAIGSGDDLGLWSMAIQSWVREPRTGYFEAGRCGEVRVADGGGPLPGPDASVPEPGPDASVKPHQDASVATSSDGGSGEPSTGCGTPGAITWQALAPLALLLKRRRR